MSSHHIVRDEQEPALLILEPNVVSFDLLMSLMEWSPTVIVSDQYLDEILSWGIKIDVVICSLAQKDLVQEKVLEQSPVQILAFHEPNYLADAFNYLLAKKYYAVNAIASLPDVSLQPEFEGLIKVVYYHHQEKLYWVEHGQYEKWMEKGQKLAVYPLQQNEVELKGLEGSLLNLEVKADQVVSVKANRGFWIKEYL